MAIYVLNVSRVNSDGTYSDANLERLQFTEWKFPFLQRSLLGDPNLTALHLLVDLLSLHRSGGVTIEGNGRGGPRDPRLLSTSGCEISIMSRVSRALYAAQLTAKSVANTFKSEPPKLFSSPEAAHERRRLRNRVGVLGYKRGMVPWYDADGTHHAATVIEVDRCQVVDVKNQEKHGYWAVQLGVGARPISRTTRPMLGHFARAQVAPKRHIVEFQIRGEEGILPLGTEIEADHLRVGQYVDVKSKTKGKGFQGVMKRWGFSGQPASHGATKVHRSGGSTGQNTDPGRVFPGKKMAGRMGFDFRTVQNLKVLDVDAEKGLVIVQGHVGGPPGRLLRITDAIKKPLPPISE